MCSRICAKHKGDENCDEWSEIIVPRNVEHSQGLVDESQDHQEAMTFDWIFVDSFIECTSTNF